MPPATHRFPVGSFVKFTAPNGVIGRFRIVEHREFTESYVVRSRNDSRDCWFNFTEQEVPLSETYEESDPW